MKSFVASISFAAVCFLSGCGSPNAGYIKQHPELTEAQKRIFQQREIFAGTDVAGLTKDQVRLAMGKEPTQYTKSQGVDAWVYEKELPKDTDAAVNATTTQKMGIDTGLQDTTEMHKYQVTTIFFNGSIATHAERAFDQHPR